MFGEIIERLWEPPCLDAKSEASKMLLPWQRTGIAWNSRLVVVAVKMLEGLRTEDCHVAQGRNRRRLSEGNKLSSTVGVACGGSL